jgi:hypothetical protein
MPKILLLLFLSSLFFASSPKGFSQTKGSPKENTKSAAADEADDSDFYSTELLASDLKQSEVVAYVNVLSYELVDQIGQGGCEQNKGAGYCLYRLKAEVKEIFKGSIKEKVFEFYKVIDADYPHKEKMLGGHVVFLSWSEDFPDKKRSLGTMENSTREIKHDILRKMRKIARKVKS